MYQYPEQHVVGVSVVPLRAGRVFDWQRFDLAKQLALREIQAQVERPLRARSVRRFVLRQTRGVRKQVFYSYRFPTPRCLRKVFRDAVAQGNPSLLNEHHDRRGHELLADGARLEDRLGLYRDPELDVRESVTLGKQNVAATVDADC